MSDEEDEMFGISDPRNPDLPDTTRTYVFDMEELENPVLLCHFDVPYAAIDQNMFVTSDKLFQANYTSVFTVWQVPEADNFGTAYQPERSAASGDARPLIEALVAATAGRLSIAA